MENAQLYLSSFHYTPDIMSKCEHTAWLEISEGKAGPLLTNPFRINQLLSDLPRPSEQFPQVTFLMGRRTKEKALRNLCDSNYRGQRHKCSINLRADNRTLHALHPRFFADCDPTNQTLQPPKSGHHVCHHERTIPFEAVIDEYSCHDLILSYFFFLFVDVICIFAEDVGGLGRVREILSTWARIGSASSLPSAVRPRVIVVLGNQPQSITQSILDEEDFLFELLHLENIEFYKTFAGIQISRLPSEELSPGARFLSLGADISRQLHDARFIRTRHSALFRASHLRKYFDIAFEGMPVSPLGPFDFVRSSRQQNPVDGAFGSHLNNFLLAGVKTSLPYDGITSHAASAILLDAYPPEMHCSFALDSPLRWVLDALTDLVFCPKTVFRKLYQGFCFTALRKVYSTNEMVNMQCQRIENRLHTLFNDMISRGATSSQIHKDNLEGQQRYWNHTLCNKTCLLCIRRSPEHILPCGHSICDQCAQIFGERSLNGEYEYIIRKCILCGSSRDLTVRLKPATAAARILSIDGGGPRGIIPLENLEMLQNILGPDLQICDMIDLAVGCSSGGLIALSKFMLRMDIGSCKALFRELAKRVFAPTRRRRLLGSWLSDGIYKVEPLEDSLKEHYTPTLRMFDTPASLLSSIKVAVTACDIKNGAPFIFANYNGSAPHRVEPSIASCSHPSSQQTLILEQHMGGCVQTMKMNRLFGKCE